MCVDLLKCIAILDTVSPAVFLLSGVLIIHTWQQKVTPKEGVTSIVLYPWDRANLTFGWLVLQFFVIKVVPYIVLGGSGTTIYFRPQPP